MKLRILATAMIIAAVSAAPASAMVSKQGLDNAINSAVTSSTVRSVVNGDTVTLFGLVESVSEAKQAENAAMKIAGVDKVINRIYSSN